MFGRTNYDKLILSSGKSTSVNNIIKHIVKKEKLDLKIDLDKYNSKKTLVGNNEIAQKKLKWFPKFNLDSLINEMILEEKKLLKND